MTELYIYMHICTDLGLQWTTNSKKDNFQYKKVFLPCIMITNEKKIPIFTTFIQKKYSDKYHKKYSKQLHVHEIAIRFSTISAKFNYLHCWYFVNCILIKSFVFSFFKESDSNFSSVPILRFGLHQNLFPVIEIIELHNISPKIPNKTPKTCEPNRYFKLLF